MNRIRKFEIEISSHCNRQCPWCSNSIVDRSNNEIMKEDIFIKIISELERAGFDRHDVAITFSKFNEPMYNFDLLEKRILQLRLYLKNVRLLINTNGDYINKKIVELPISELSIMDYDNKGIDYGALVIEGLGANHINRLPTRLVADINNIKVNYLYDWQKHFKIEDRGGLLSSSVCEWKNNREIRDYPCFVSGRPLSIDYLGNVTPCCHIRGDADQHKEYIMGNIKESSMSDIFNNDKFKKFNQNMESKDISKYHDPCKRCQKLL